MKKRRIDERLSVNDDVLSMTDGILHNIIEDSEFQPMVRGKNTELCIKKGNFSYSCKKNGLTITVIYTIFYPKSRANLENFLEKGLLNCKCDVGDKIIEINTWSLNGSLDPTLKSDISHEVNHIYQYHNGFTRNNGLYDIVSNIANDNGMDLRLRVPSFLIYYTFRHEVDSFAVQFYQLLKNGEIKDNGNVSDALRQFPTYQSVINCISYVKDKNNRNHVKQGIKMTGLTMNQWKHRVFSGIERFKEKLKRVYWRYVLEKQQKDRCFEATMKIETRFISRYGVINEEIEPMFEFDNDESGHKQKKLSKYTKHNNKTVQQ